MSPNSRVKSGKEGEGRAGTDGGRVSVLKKTGGNGERKTGSRSPRRETNINASSDQPQAWPLPSPPPGFIPEKSGEKPPSWTGLAVSPPPSHVDEMDVSGELTGGEKGNKRKKRQKRKNLKQKD